MLTEEIKKYIDQSVLCWLASASEVGVPNVSPKEIFTYFQGHIIIANIASPNTVKNIKQNKQVCISFLDILVQKGVQLKGTAEIVEKGASCFEAIEKELLKLTGGNFPFHSVTKIEIKNSKPILAPRYLLYPETKESEQVARAKKQYGLLD